MSKHRDVVEFFIGRQGWEVTYRGKKPQDKDILDDFLRRRDHSIELAMRGVVQGSEYDPALRG